MTDDTRRLRLLEIVDEMFAYGTDTTAPIARQVRAWANRLEADIEPLEAAAVTPEGDRLEPINAVVANRSQPLSDAQRWELERDDVVCEHGTAMDVHCCNCHSGFIFDMDHQCSEVERHLPEEHDPLCSLGQQAGDQTMPCDCDGAPVRSPEAAAVTPKEPFFKPNANFKQVKDWIKKD